MADLGTAFVQVAPDTTALTAKMGAYFQSSRWKGMGKAAGIGIGAGLAAGVVVKGLYEIGQAFDDASDKIRVGTGATGKQLRGLERDFDSVVSSVPTNFDNASTAIADLNQRLGITGKPLQKLSKGMLELSRITDTDVQTNIRSITRLYGDWGIKASKQTGTLDKLYRAGQATGVQIADLSDLMVQFGSPLRQLGLDFDTAVAMFSRFEKEGVNIQTLMPGLRFALKNFSAPTAELSATLQKLGVDLKEGPAAALQDVFAALDKAPSDLKANALAFEVFGARAGPDMAAAVREGRFELDDLMKTIVNGKDTVAEAGRDTRDFGEEWEVLKNNVFVALEPVARNLFETIGKEMRGLTRILTDDSLTRDEKISAVLGKISGAIREYLPKLAELGGRVGLSILRGIGDAFLHSGILGKLFIGASAIRIFGGAGALTSLGRTMGTRLSTTMATTAATGGVTGAAASGWTRMGSLAGKLIGPAMGLGIVAMLATDPAVQKAVRELISGEMLDSSNREDFATEIENAFKLGEGTAQFIGRENVKIRTALGTLIFNSETEKIVKARGKKLKDLVGEQYIEALTIFNRRLERSADQSRAEDTARYFGKFEKGLRGIGKGAIFAGREIGRYADQVDRETGDAGDKAERSRDRIGKSFDQIAYGASFAGRIWGDYAGNVDDATDRTDRRSEKHAGESKRNLGKVRTELTKTERQADDYADGTGDDYDRASRSAKKMAGKIGASAQSVAQAVKGGMENIATNTNEALKTFNVKKLAFSFKDVGKTASTVFAQHGAIVPGTGSGDTVPLHIGGQLAAMVEPGEMVSVANRTYTEALMRGNSEVRRRPGKPAHMRSGGIVPVPGWPGEYANSKIIPALTGYLKRFNLWLSDAYGPGKHSSLEHTKYGTAADVGPLDGDWAKFGQTALRYAVGQGWTPVYYDGSYGTTAASNHGPGNHAHVTFLTVAELLGGKGVGGGAAFEAIARTLIEGPNGPMKSIGQGALDKARKAANDYLRKKAPGPDANGGSNYDVGGGVLSMGELSKLVQAHRGPKIFPWVAYAESGGDPNAGNGLYEGLFALGSPFWTDYAPAGSGSWSANVHDPNANTSVAVAGYNAAGLGPWADSQWKGGGGGWGQHVGEDWPGLMRGGIVPMLAGGGFPKPTKGGKGPGLGKLLDRIKGKTAKIAALDERIDIATRLAEQDSSPGQSDYTKDEAGTIKGLDRRLLDQLTGQRDLVQDALKLAGGRVKGLSGRLEDGGALARKIDSKSKKLKAAKKLLEDTKNAGEKKHLEKQIETLTKDLADLRERRSERRDKLRSRIGKSKDQRTTLTELLEELQGVTGGGGRIFDTKLAIDSITATATPAGAEAMDISQLRSVIEAARFGVFDGQLPKFHGGGIYRAPAGRNEGPAILKDGERISTPGGVNVENRISFDGMGAIIETYVDGALAKRERVAHRGARQYAPMPIVSRGGR